MRKSLNLVFLSLIFLLIPASSFAATKSAAESTAILAVAKKPVVKKVLVKKPVVKKPVVVAKKITKAKAKVIARRGKSLAEGVDTRGANATAWQGTVIGINEGAHSIIITEATAINHIKAFQQRYVQVTDNTDITQNSEDRLYSQIDIGYRVTVRGAYDAKKRTISARSIEITSAPASPVSAADHQ